MQLGTKGEVSDWEYRYCGQMPARLIGALLDGNGVQETAQCNCSTGV